LPQNSLALKNTGSFGPERRVKKRRDFLEAQKSGQKLYSRHLLIYVLPNGFETARLGVTVSKKVDSRAVVRNRLRRQIKEIFRLNQSRLLRPFDIIVIARQNAVTCKFDDLRREMLGALHHGGCLQ
jgi:ribonuclease P protein component